MSVGKKPTNRKEPTVALRYEIVDSTSPTLRGMRFGTLERAEREWRRAYPRERFWIKDRTTKKNVTPTTTA